MASPLQSLEVAVVGGGISGLAAAYALQKAGRRVALFEAATTLGGCIGSIQNGPYLADRGPQTFVSAPALLELIADLGLESRVQYAGGAGAKRYIYRHGRLLAVPMSAGAFLASPLLSTAAKLRLLAEPFVSAERPGAANGAGDESVASFFTRRIGAESVDAIAAPVMSGIYAGDSDRLSARSALPALVRFERERGSIVRGYLASRRRAPAAQASKSRSRAAIGFSGGNATLIEALGARLSGLIYTGARAVSLHQRGAGFALEFDGLPERTVEAARVLVATPAGAAAALLAPLEADAAAALREIRYVPIAQVAVAYERAAVGVPLDGFGFLTCRGEDVRILGAVWNSAIFPDRAPGDRVLCTAFVGGALDEKAAQLRDDELALVVDADLRRVMRIGRSKLVIVGGFRWAAAIPQYELGHEQRLGRISAAVARMPGLTLAGNYFDGISTADCIRRAKQAASALSSGAAALRRDL
ncbi:MAG: protoporphyrinogen oxidase [Candidatus Eremiobacteraeota bacterium]|nr:protoporphyrinogen oxidase [Candidatus Eremiobacteraeota bacterium]